MGESFDVKDQIGIITQAAVFFLALILLLIVELVEHKRFLKRRERLTNFTPTNRISQSPSDDDFLSNIR